MSSRGKNVRTLLQHAAQHSPTCSTGNDIHQMAQFMPLANAFGPLAVQVGTARGLPPRPAQAKHSDFSERPAGAPGNPPGLSAGLFSGRVTRIVRPAAVGLILGRICDTGITRRPDQPADSPARHTGSFRLSFRPSRTRGRATALTAPPPSRTRCSSPPPLSTVPSLPPIEGKGTAHTHLAVGPTPQPSRSAGPGGCAGGGPRPLHICRSTGGVR